MTSQFTRLLLQQKGPVAEVTLNRPEIHNAFDPVMIQELTEIFSILENHSEVRVVHLTGAGKSFCAGADLAWMKGLADASHQENIEDAKRLEVMLRSVGNFSKPLIVYVNGAAIGGGCGLACCGDIVLAAPAAKFGLSEVRLGILPAVIAPYVMRRIGFSASSRYMLSGERFTAEEAQKINLVNEIIAGEVSEKLERITLSLLKGGIEAQSATKKLMRDILRAKNEETVSSLTSQAIADRRVSEEGQEGMQAFFEKRAANWSPS